MAIAALAPLCSVMSVVGRKSEFVRRVPLGALPLTDLVEAPAAAASRPIRPTGASSSSITYRPNPGSPIPGASG